MIIFPSRLNLCTCFFSFLFFYFFFLFFLVSEQKTKIRYAVLDGVNELLLGSCKSQVYEIFGSHLVSCSRIIVLSTTLPKELTEFKDDFMNETVQIIVKKDDLFSFHGKVDA